MKAPRKKLTDVLYVHVCLSIYVGMICEKAVLRRQQVRETTVCLLFHRNAYWHYGLKNSKE